MGGPDPPVGVASRGLCPFAPRPGLLPPGPGPSASRSLQPLGQRLVRPRARPWLGRCCRCCRRRCWPRRASPGFCCCASPPATSGSCLPSRCAPGQPAPSAEQRAPAGRLGPEQRQAAPLWQPGTPHPRRAALPARRGGVLGTPRSPPPRWSLSRARPGSCLSAPQMQPPDAPGCGWARGS